jgi:hypothetical protein
MKLSALHRIRIIYSPKHFFSAQNKCPCESTHFALYSWYTRGAAAADEPHHFTSAPAEYALQMLYSRAASTNNMCAYTHFSALLRGLPSTFCPVLNSKSPSACLLMFITLCMRVYSGYANSTLRVRGCQMAPCRGSWPMSLGERRENGLSARTGAIINNRHHLLRCCLANNRELH